LYRSAIDFSSFFTSLGERFNTHKKLLSNSDILFLIISFNTSSSRYQVLLNSSLIHLKIAFFISSSTFQEFSNLAKSFNQSNVFQFKAFGNQFGQILNVSKKAYLSNNGFCLYISSVT
jgi:hypothetical protein